MDAKTSHSGDAESFVRLTPQLAAKVAFAALVTLCGVCVHLIAELAALGWRADGELIVSVHHIPLGLVTLTAIGALGALGLGIARDPKRKAFVAEMIRALPDGGCGWRFLSLAFVAQLFVFAVTEAGEGLPIQAGDLVLSVVAALCASVIGALLVWRYQRRVIEAINEIVLALITVSTLSRETQTWKRGKAHARVWRCRAVVFAGSRRPPPSTLKIDPFVSNRGSQEIEGERIRMRRRWAALVERGSVRTSSSARSY